MLKQFVKAIFIDKISFINEFLMKETLFWGFKLFLEPVYIFKIESKWIFY